jgi:hypothetical protein
LPFCSNCRLLLNHHTLSQKNQKMTTFFIPEHMMLA